MLDNRFKQIYIDLEDGTWYVTDETSESKLRGLRVEVPTASTSWYVKHYRRTNKIIFQVLGVDNAEIIPETVLIIDQDTVLIEFGVPTAGTLHLVFDKDSFFDVVPSPTPTTTPTTTPTVTPTDTPQITPTPTVTPTATVTPTQTLTPTTTATPSVTPTNTVTPTVTPTSTPPPTLTPSVTDVILEFPFENDSSVSITLLSRNVYEYSNVTVSVLNPPDPYEYSTVNVALLQRETHDTSYTVMSIVDASFV